MCLVVIGKSGQLAKSLQNINPSAVCLGRNEIDIVDPKDIDSILNQYEVSRIINASAYTAVDLAESEPNAAFEINEKGVRNLANYAEKHNIHLVHVSSDYVFSGVKGIPYKVDDSYAPLGVYGKSKVAGEKALNKIMPNRSSIIRTSWVYSSNGNNFVKTMIRLMNEKSTLNVIDDQIGTPTSAVALANACLFASNKEVTGIHHFTDAGVCSWFDFALAIQELGVKHGLIKNQTTILPISTASYPTAARRPQYSVLDKSTLRSAFEGLQLNHWRTELENVLLELRIMETKT